MPLLLYGELTARLFLKVNLHLRARLKLASHLASPRGISIEN